MEPFYVDFQFQNVLLTTELHPTFHRQGTELMSTDFSFWVNVSFNIIMSALSL